MRKMYDYYEDNFIFYLKFRNRKYEKRENIHFRYKRTFENR